MALQTDIYQVFSDIVGPENITAEPVKADEVLDIRGFWDLPYHFFVADTQFVFDNQSADHVAGTNTRPAHCGEVFGIGAFKAGPIDKMRQLDPAIRRVEFATERQRFFKKRHLLDVTLAKNVQGSHL